MLFHAGLVHHKVAVFELRPGQVFIKRPHLALQYLLPSIHHCLLFLVPFLGQLLHLTLDALLLALLIGNLLFNDAALCMFHLLQVIGDAFLFFVLCLMGDKFSLVDGGVNESGPGSGKPVLGAGAFLGHGRIGPGESVLYVFHLAVDIAFPCMLHFAIILIFFPFCHLLFHCTYLFDHMLFFLMLFLVLIEVGLELVGLVLPEFLYFVQIFNQLFVFLVFLELLKLFLQFLLEAVAFKLILDKTVELNKGKRY